MSRRREKRGAVSGVLTRESAKGSAGDGGPRQTQSAQSQLECERAARIGFERYLVLVDEHRLKVRRSLEAERTVVHHGALSLAEASKMLGRRANDVQTLSVRLELARAELERAQDENRRRGDEAAALERWADDFTTHERKVAAWLSEAGLGPVPPARHRRGQNSLQAQAELGRGYQQLHRARRDTDRLRRDPKWLWSYAHLVAELSEAAATAVDAARREAQAASVAVENRRSKVDRLGASLKQARDAFETQRQETARRRSAFEYAEQRLAAVGAALDVQGSRQLSAADDGLDRSQNGAPQTSHWDLARGNLETLADAIVRWLRRSSTEVAKLRAACRAALEVTDARSCRTSRRARFPSRAPREPGGTRTPTSRGSEASNAVVTGLALLTLAIGIGIGAAIWAGTPSSDAAAVSQPQLATSRPAPPVMRSREPAHRGVRFVDSTGFLPGTIYVFKVSGMRGGQAFGPHVQIDDGFWYRLCNSDQSVCAARVRGR